jgi:hypothetical protein
MLVSDQHVLWQAGTRARRVAGEQALPSAQACSCPERWVAPLDLEAGGAGRHASGAGDGLARLRVRRPADLAWADLACEVSGVAGAGRRLACVRARAALLAPATCMGLC